MEVLLPSLDSWTHAIRLTLFFNRYFIFISTVQILSRCCAMSRSVSMGGNVSNIFFFPTGSNDCARLHNRIPGQTALTTSVTTSVRCHQRYLDTFKPEPPNGILETGIPILLELNNYGGLRTYVPRSLRAMQLMRPEHPIAWVEHPIFHTGCGLVCKLMVSSTRQWLHSGHHF